MGLASIVFGFKTNYIPDSFHMGISTFRLTIFQTVFTWELVSTFRSTGGGGPDVVDSDIFT